MKKTISLLICLLVFMTAMSVSAKYVENANYGMYFDLGDNWQTMPDNSEWQFFYEGNADEYIKIEQVQLNGMAVSLSDEVLLNTVAKNVLSDDKLKADYFVSGGPEVSIKVSYEKGEYVKHNNVDYYKYIKEYEVSAEGYNPSTYCDYLYLTVKNDRLYAITYSRISSQDHFAEFEEFLNSIYYNFSDIKIKVNGRIIQPDSAPYIEKDRALVPFRAVAEALNYKVEWDAVERAVTVISADGSKSVRMCIGSLDAVKNGTEIIKLEVAPAIKDDRTYLPIRAIGETLGAYIGWNESLRTIIVND